MTKQPFFQGIVSIGEIQLRYLAIYLLFIVKLYFVSDKNMSVSCFAVLRRVFS